MKPSYLQQNRYLIFLGTFFCLLSLYSPHAFCQPNTHDLAQKSPDSPINDQHHHITLSSSLAVDAPIQGATQYAKITLQDGSVLTGVILHIPGNRMIVVGYTNQEGLSVIDYLSEALVKQFEAIQPENPKATSVYHTLNTPIQAKLFSLTGELAEGVMQSGSNDYIVVVPKGGEKSVAYPMAALSRMTLMGSPSRTTQEEQESPQKTTQENPNQAQTSSIAVASGAQTVAPSNQQIHPQLARVILKDGSTLTGHYILDVNNQAIVLMYKGSDGLLTVDSIKAPLVEKTEPISAESSEVQPITGQLNPPIASILTLSDGQTLKGMWQPVSSPGQISIVLEGSSQATAIPADSVLRIVLTGSAAPSVPAQPSQTQASPPQANESQVPAAQSLMTLVLHNNSTIEGYATTDPQTQMILVIQSSETGVRIYNYIQPALVKQMQPSQTKPAAEVDLKSPIKSPISITVVLSNGQTAKGTWQAANFQGAIVMTPEGAQQPTTVPLSAILRMTLTEGSGISQSGSSISPSQTTVSMSSANNVKAGQYTSIPISPLPAKMPDVPPVGTNVSLKTNLSQNFEGTIDAENDLWLSLYVNKIASMELNPPQLTVVSKKHIVSIDRVNEPKN